MMNYMLNLPLPRAFPFFRQPSTGALLVPEPAPSSSKASSGARPLSRAPSTSPAAPASSKKENLAPIRPPSTAGAPAPGKLTREFSITASAARPRLFTYEASIISSAASKSYADSPISDPDDDGASVYSFMPGDESGARDPELARRDPRAIVPVDLGAGATATLYSVPLQPESASSADSDEHRNAYPFASAPPPIPGGYPLTPPPAFGPSGHNVAYRAPGEYEFLVSPIARPRNPPPPSPAGVVGRPPLPHTFSAPLPLRARPPPPPTRGFSDPGLQQQQQQHAPPGLVQALSPQVPVQQMSERWERAPRERERRESAAPPPVRERRESTAGPQTGMRREAATPAPGARERRESVAVRDRRESTAPLPPPGLRERRPSFAPPPPSSFAPPPPPSRYDSYELQQQQQPLSVPVPAPSMSRTTSRRERTTSVAPAPPPARYERERRASSAAPPSARAPMPASSRLSASWPAPAEDALPRRGLRREASSGGAHTDSEAPAARARQAQLQTLLGETGMSMAASGAPAAGALDMNGPYPRGVRWDERLICPSPVPAHARRRGWYNRRGDQLWTNTGTYRSPPPGQDYPPDLAHYPAPGHGWENEEGVRIDMQHRPKKVRSALKKGRAGAGMRQM